MHTRGILGVIVVNSQEKVIVLAFVNNAADTTIL